jgi:subtilisin family serine protease
LANLDDGQDMVTGIITMADQVDLRALQDRLYAERADRRAWHEAVVLALREMATLTQADIIARLDQMIAAGEVERYRSLWLANIVFMTGTPAAMNELVARADVAQISPDYPIEAIEPISIDEDEPVIAGVEPGLSRIRADSVWAMGYTGAGRLVSHLDTGVDGTHPALGGRWKGVSDPRYAGHPEWAWFDPLTNTDFPFDSAQRGTHVMGTICGRGAYDTIGVAIDAEWISAAVIGDGRIEDFVQDALLALQWTADPDSNPATVWDVPDVSCNGWGLTVFHGYPPCDETFWLAIDGCEAAGVVVVFGAGGDGPGAATIRNPASRATTGVNCFAVGAVDGAYPETPIASFSSRGPSNCTPDGSDAFKPEVVAPGINIRSSVPGGGYQGGWSGTSMALAHVAGVVALMRQANPDLPSENVKQILLATALDRGNPGEDNNYGMGLIDTYAAVLAAIGPDWTGLLSGVVSDSVTGLPLEGARVASLDSFPFTYSGPDGRYFLWLPLGDTLVVKAEKPPTHLPQFDTVMVVNYDTTFRDFALEPTVPVTLTASFGNPHDVDYRHFYFKGSWDSLGLFDPAWSGPAKEVADDGMAPDTIAGDGIFTGVAYLARDLAHTFSWAIYAENYGGDGSRLQHGTDFQVLDYSAVIVPTLSVNPSGNDHNWNISVYGNGGALQIELLRGCNGISAKWCGAAWLNNGQTYTFTFRPMHSTMANWGVGGVGGTPIVFTCTYSGSYEFKFDDRTDEYAVILSGTEGVPVGLTATGGLDGHVSLAWFPPGTPGSQEVSYDDGVTVNAYYLQNESDLMATMFVPHNYPIVIDSVMIHLLTQGDPNYPWPDNQHDPIGISIFLDDGTGYPQIDPAFYIEATLDEPGEWLRIDVGNINVEYGFYWICVNNLIGGGQEGLGLDVSTDFPANQWVRQNGVWGLQQAYAGDHMIRAKVFGTIRLAGDPSPLSEIPAAVPWIGDPALSSGTVAAREIPPATSAPRIDRAAHLPISVGGDSPTPTEVQWGHYAIYRDTLPNPYQRNPRINVETFFLHEIYDDWGGTLDSIQNGVTYYYQVSAIYELLDSLGNPIYIEIGPSNQASATPRNNPPATPSSLSGTVDNRTVILDWAFTNPVIDSTYDLHHFAVYKKLVADTLWILDGITTDSAYADTIPVGQDGIYAFGVTAVDDGAPALESGFSNVVVLGIGYLPPTNLVALSNYNSFVPLSWERPPVPGFFGFYNIYRFTTPGFIPDSTNRIRDYHDQYGEQWNDSTAVNGTTYYYKVMGVYDNNGEIVESPPSNEASATPGSGCSYIVGDINGDDSPNGIDVTYGVSYFKGGPEPPYACECVLNEIWFVAGDVNGSCNFSGIDITYFVRYLKGGPALIPCPDCPPGVMDILDAGQ